MAVVTSSQPQASSAPTTNAQLSACYDSIDIESFIDYDQALFASPSLSSSRSNSQKGKSIIPSSNNTLLPPQQAGPQSNGPQNFSGPSHQYDLHKQQTGLPVGGAAAASNLALNPALLSASSTQNSFGVSPTSESMFTPTMTPATRGSFSPTEDYMFLSTRNGSSFSGASDMDFEFDSPADEGLASVLYPERSLSSSSEYVNPNVIGGEEELSSLKAETPVQSNMGRLWPGMHSQQAAAAAKAQLQQRQQHERLQQQKRVAVQHTHQQGRPKPSSTPTDPVIEERISRLLQSMRQNANAHDDDADSPGSLHPHIQRMKKDEEDMDEDERLLASEEGKKLSSKERRQLRNKVSARAFRSRRKEYIGQLEAEVAVKATEANELRVQNRALMDENTRLSDLTRMLLSSPAFSNFLDTLAPTEEAPAPEPTQSTRTESARPTETVQQIRKDVNPYAAQQQLQNQQNPQVGMTFVPDTNVDFSMLDLNNNWALGNMGGSTWTNPQVFSVLEMPQGPAVDQVVDTGALSGKSSNFVPGTFADEDAKDKAPVIERMPVIQETAEEVAPIVDESFEDTLEESDPAFALYAQAPVKASEAETPVELQLFGGVDLEKAFSRLELVSTEEQDDEVSAFDMERFERLCNGADTACDRIGQMLGEL
jgi:hypothetical protein